MTAMIQCVRRRLLVWTGKSNFHGIRLHCAQNHLILELTVHKDSEGPPWQAGSLFVCNYSRRLEIGGIFMRAVRMVFLASLLFLATAVLAFCAYPWVQQAVHSINQGVSSGYNPEGLFWSRSYNRFIPSEYESQAAAAFDVGIAVLCVSGFFYGFLLLAQRRSASRQI